MAAEPMGCWTYLRRFLVIWGRPALWPHSWLHDPLFGRALACAWRAGPSQLGCRVGLAGSDREFPPVYCRSGTQRGRAYLGEHLIRRSMEFVRSVRRNPDSQVNVLASVRAGLHQRDDPEHDRSGSSHNTGHRTDHRPDERIHAVTIRTDFTDESELPGSAPNGGTVTAAVGPY